MCPMVVVSENVNMSSPNSAEVSGSPSPAPSSIGNNAPKYGTLVPNRVFVGGISAHTTEQDLLELFSQYGIVKATKIINDRAGVSKGYGFVTFETEEEARRLTQEADNIMLKDRKLNIAPAIKKQVTDVGYIKNYSPRLIDTSSSVLGGGGTVFFSNGAGYTTVPVMAPTEYHPTFPQASAAAAAAAAAAAPTSASSYQTIMYPQPVYYPQQYQYQPAAQTVQPQWGAAPQWRWITPSSYPQPECSPQHCLAEHSSPTSGESTTASATGTPPLHYSPPTNTHNCSPTPTTATATTSTTTTTTCATVKTFSTTITRTTATPTVCVKVSRSQDPMPPQKKLQPQPTIANPFNGRPKLSATVASKPAFEEDKDYITPEESKVDGGSNGIHSSPSVMPHTAPSSHNSMTSSSTGHKVANTTYFNYASGHGNSKASKTGLGRRTTEGVGAGMSDDQGCSRMMGHTLGRTGEPSGAVNQHSYRGEYNTDFYRAGNNSVQANWGGSWIPITFGKEAAWRPFMSHSSVYQPPQYSGRAAYQYGNPRHYQAHHMATPQSWTPIGWPLMIPPDQSHSLRNTSPSYSHHNASQTLVMPHLAYSPHNSAPYSATQVHSASQSQAQAQSHHVMEPPYKTPYSRPTSVQTNNDASLYSPATPNNYSSSGSSSSNGGSAATTDNTKPGSPNDTSSSYVNRKSPSAYLRNAVEQTPYGYVNQQHMIMMPYYQYSGSVAPYCNWTAPVVMQMPMTQSPTAALHSTPNNAVRMAAQPKSLEHCLPHTAFTFTPQNEKHSSPTVSPQQMTPKFKEAFSPASSNIDSSKPVRGAHQSLNYNRNRNFKGQAFHSLPYNSSPEMLYKHPDQKKGSAFPQVFSSAARRSAMSPSKFPRPLAPSQSQIGLGGKGFGSSSGVVTTATALAGQEEHCTTGLMTPPPTPLPNIDEISDAVANSSES